MVDEGTESIEVAAQALRDKRADRLASIYKKAGEPMLSGFFVC